MLSSKQSAEQNKKHNGQPKLRVLQASQIQNYRMLKQNEEFLIKFNLTDLALKRDLSSN